MIDQLPSLKQFIKNLQQVPYLASKNLFRVLTYFLNMNDEKFQEFCRSMVEVRENIIKCEVCWFWKEKKEGCVFCTSNKRDKSVICVVETWQELIAIEKTGGFNGVYHVLGGAVCPLDGIGPEDLSIEQLVKRINGDVKEIIFALNQTPEAEATAAYISNRLNDKKINISCLARGIPVGSVLEFMDRVTLYKALSERRPF